MALSRTAAQSTSVLIWHVAKGAGPNGRYWGTLGGFGEC